MRVEVAYARPDRQWLWSVEVPAGTTAMEAIRQSGVVAACPEVDPESAPLGIFGEACSRETLLRPGDRVEIHRPLKRDPKTARRERAAVDSRKSGQKTQPRD